MGGCSVPKILGIKRWFDEHLKDICDEHDEFYLKRTWKCKVQGDFLVAAKLAERGYILLAFASMPYLIFLGTPYWAWKKLNRPN